MACFIYEWAMSMLMVNSTMKVLLVGERYWPEVGAAPFRLENLAEGLSQNNCKVDVLTALPNYPKGRFYEGYNSCFSRFEHRHGINIFRYWIYATVSKRPMDRIANMFSFAITIWTFALKKRRIRNYDVVIIQTPTLVVAASAMIIFKWIYRRTCILNVSDIWPLTALDMGAITKKGFSWRFLSLLEHFLYREANGIMGQSEEILNHVQQEILSGKGLWGHNAEKDTDDVLSSNLWTLNSRLFLYRNIVHNVSIEFHRKKNCPMKIIYSGMLGVAQNILDIVKNVSFKHLGVELHIYGGGKQYNDLLEYTMSHPDSNVVIHGQVSKEEMNKIMSQMDVSLVPLAARIRGAFPSKIYDSIANGLPVLFCGAGEGARFVEVERIGLVAIPDDYENIESRIVEFRNMSIQTYMDLSEHCKIVCRHKLNFEHQLESCREFLNLICR